MKYLSLPLLLTIVFVFLGSSSVFALDKRGYLPYKISMYENDVEISSSYHLKEREKFLVVCDAKNEQIPMQSRVTTDSLTVFPAMLWNQTLYCHISVIDTSRKGRIILSSGTVKVKTPKYYLP